MGPIKRVGTFVTRGGCLVVVALHWHNAVNARCIRCEQTVQDLHLLSSRSVFCNDRM